MVFRLMVSLRLSMIGLAKRSAAFIKMKAGLVIRPWSFKSR